MFEWLKKELRASVLKRSLKKAAPDKFPYDSGNDYYTSTLVNTKSEESILIDALIGENIIGKRWENDRYSIPVEISLRETLEWNIQISRFYGFARYDYKSVRSFLIGEYTFRPFRNWLLDRASQSLYNASIKFQQDRVEVLRRLVELSVSEAIEENPLLHTPSPKSIVSLQSEYFGKRIYGHPARNEVSARFRLLIESLVASGDLKKTQQHEFQLEAQAIVTLSEYQRDERKHKDNVRHHWLIFGLTLVIAIATAFGVYDTWQN